MTAFLSDLWPPTRSVRSTLVWSLVLGLTVPIAAALLLRSVGFEDAAALVFLPGWIVILRATGGFFASLTVVGNAVFIGTTALAYSAVLFCAMRLWAWKRAS